MTSHHEEQQRLLRDLHADGSPEALRQAEQLRELYHAKEMAGLSHDVYDSAREIGGPPAGWVRASENLELLRQAMPELRINDSELRELMKPRESGFRAEIYLPNPEVLGPGYKPTVVFKGSANEVRMPDGTLRSTAAEDFLGNNFPQSVGLRTDYYDRAMDLANQLNQAGLDFDLSGHSLGGGMASAASAVTGMRAVTHNSAGLHAETAQRFSRDHGGLPLYDTAATVTAWQVQGDLLNDGVQGDLANLGAWQRARMAGLLSDVSSVVQNVPQAREMLQDKLLSGIPESSHPAIDAFLDRLAQGNAAHLIRDLPQAVGERMPPLVAMTEQERALVRREHAASIGELHQLAGPLLTVASASARGAELGRHAGEVVAGGGRLAGRGVDVAGDVAGGTLSQAGTFAEQGYRVTGITLNHGTRAVGEVAAQWREARAGAEAFVDRAQGWTQEQGDRVRAGGLRWIGSVVGRVSESWQRDLETQADAVAARGTQARARGQADAADALERGAASATAIRGVAGAAGSGVQDAAERAGGRHRDALVFVGERLDAGLDVVGNRITGATANAPAAGAAVGGTTGLLVGAGVTYHPQNPFTGYNLRSTVELVRQAGGAMQESVARHGMDSAMIPSLDSEIARQEAAARAQLQRIETRDGADRGQGAGAGVDPSDRALRPVGEFGVRMEGFLDAVRGGDAATISRASEAFLATPEARDWVENGQRQLDAAQRAAAQELRTATAEEPAVAR